MYPELDEAIYTALKNSENPILKPFQIKLPGNKQINPNTRSIMIGNIGNKLETIGNDFDDRRISYSLRISIQRINYLEAMQLLRDVTMAVVKALRDKLDEKYMEYMQIDDILPLYDEGDGWAVRKAEIQISFLVEEYYGKERVEFDDVQVRGGLN